MNTNSRILWQYRDTKAVNDKVLYLPSIYQLLRIKGALSLQLFIILSRPAKENWKESSNLGLIYMSLGVGLSTKNYATNVTLTV